jgi:hypothetical protein
VQQANSEFQKFASNDLNHDLIDTPELRKQLKEYMQKTFKNSPHIIDLFEG